MTDLLLFCVSNPSNLKSILEQIMSRYLNVVKKWQLNSVKNYNTQKYNSLLKKYSIVITNFCLKLEKSFWLRLAIYTCVVS